MYHKIVKL